MRTEGSIDLVREHMHRAAETGDLVAMSVVAQEAELGQAATDWIYRDYGHDPPSMDFIMRGML
ncbi:MAG: hypothetical protein ACYC0X_00095 [Pirellulaceae bacterium]